MSEALTNDAFLGFRAPAELVEALDVAAAKACRSRSQEMRFRLEQSFESGQLVGVQDVSRTGRTPARDKPCPHRVPAGSFCARCGS